MRQTSVPTLTPKPPFNMQQRGPTRQVCLTGHHNGPLAEQQHEDQYLPSSPSPRPPRPAGAGSCRPHLPQRLALKPLRPPAQAACMCPCFRPHNMYSGDRLRRFSIAHVSTCLPLLACQAGNAVSDLRALASWPIKGLARLWPQRCVRLGIGSRKSGGICRVVLQRPVPIVVWLGPKSR